MNYQNGLRIKQWQNEKQLIIESDKIRECIQFINSDKFKDFKGIIISKDLGYKENNLDFLYMVNHLSSILLSDDIADISAIYSMKNLQGLNLAENKQEIHLSYFQNLESLSFDWSHKIKDLDSCAKLTKLTIGKFNPKNNDISILPALDCLKELKLVQSTIKSLNGIEKYNCLNRIELYFLTKLEDIKAITQIKELKFLHFEACRKIRNIESVKELKNVIDLSFFNCGEISSIKFTREMPMLKNLRLVGTNIIDGDMSPCIGLEYAGFINKKHYSHTFEEIEALNRQKLHRSQD